MLRKAPSSDTFNGMDTLLYLLVLFAFLTAGMITAKTVIPRSWSGAVDNLLSLCLYLLLFFMGVRTGLIEDIAEKLTMIGSLALLFAALNAAGSAVMVILLGYLVRHRSIDVSEERLQESGEKNSLLSHLKEPAKLLLCVISGALLAAFTPLFSWFSDSVADILLYLLLYFVGVQMYQSDTDVIGVFKDPRSLLLPLGTITGTLLSSLLVPLFVDIQIFESLAISSGFGWYSLSGVLISELGDPVLGSVAFLSNLFRESIAFLVIPLLAGFGKEYAAISVGGATSMDVTLPIVEKSCGTSYVPLSLAHGILLTLVVPFLVPLFYAWVV